MESRERGSGALRVPRERASPTPHKNSILGVTAGAGGQLIDPVGVRVIPEVRYTRWFGATFDSLGLRSRRDQVEIVISIYF